MTKCITGDNIISALALVAQLDRVLDYESRGQGFESLLAHHENGWSKRTGHFYFSNFRDSTLKNKLSILRRTKAPLVCSLFSLPPPSFICHRQRSASSPERVAALNKQSSGLFVAGESLSGSESQLVCKAQSAVADGESLMVHHQKGWSKRTGLFYFALSDVLINIIFRNL